MIYIKTDLFSSGSKKKLLTKFVYYEDLEKLPLKQYKMSTYTVSYDLATVKHTKARRN